MKRLASLWNALTACRERSVLAIRALALLTFAAAGASLGARVLHHASLADFCGGLALGISAALVFIVFNLQAADFKNEADDSRMTELKLSR
jgi:hypothetical protein